MTFLDFPQLYSDLSKWKFQDDTIQFDVGTNSEAPLFLKIRGTPEKFYQLTASSGGLLFGKAENGVWTDLWKAATKADLADAATYNPMIVYDGSKTVAEFCQSVKSGTTATVYVSSSYKTAVTGLPSQDGYYVTVYKSKAAGYGVFEAIPADGTRIKCVEEEGKTKGWS